MQNRRDFLKTAALAAFSSGLVARQALAGESLLSTIHINKLGLGWKMKMTFFPLMIEVVARVYSCHLFAYNNSRCAGRNRI